MEKKIYFWEKKIVTACSQNFYKVFIFKY